MNILLVLPIYISNELHFQDTKISIDYLKSSNNRRNLKKDLLIVENLNQNKYKSFIYDSADILIKNNENILGRTWNIGITYGIKYEYDYILIMNNDIALHPDAIDNLTDFIDNHPEFLVYTSHHHDNLETLPSVELKDKFDEAPNFSCFAVTPRIEFLSKLEKDTEPYPGLFDENIRPIYFEDIDYHYRLVKYKYKAVKVYSSIFYHQSSSSIRHDDELRNLVKIAFQTNREYLIKKWGENIKLWMDNLNC